MGEILIKKIITITITIKTKTKNLHYPIIMKYPLQRLRDAEGVLGRLT